MICVCIYISGKQRLKVYPEGGCELERHVKGIGWCIDNESCDGIGAVKEALTMLARCKENLELVA